MQRSKSALLLCSAFEDVSVFTLADYLQSARLAMSNTPRNSRNGFVLFARFAQNLGIVWLKGINSSNVPLPNVLVEGAALLSEDRGADSFVFCARIAEHLRSVLKYG